MHMLDIGLEDLGGCEAGANAADTLLAAAHVIDFKPLRRLRYLITLSPLISIILVIGSLKQTYWPVAKYCDL